MVAVAADPAAADLAAAVGVVDPAAAVVVLGTDLEAAVPVGPEVVWEGSAEVPAA